MAQSKRIRFVHSDDEEVLAEAPAEGASEAPKSSHDDDDYEEHFTEEGDPVDRRMTVPMVVEICNQLEMGVNSLVHFGISFRFRKDRHKRLDKIIKQIEDIRIAVQFDEFMATKKERGEN
jgi:hypothetical protein